MPTVSIDQLTLRLSGFSESDGRRLAELIGEGLAHAEVGSQSSTHPSLQTRITARPGSDVRGVADEAVADLIRQLQRSV